MITKKKVKIATPKGCFIGFHNIFDKYKIPIINAEQNIGGQKASIYNLQEALVIFLDKGYQMINILSILKITPIAAPEIPQYTIKG